MARKGLKGGGGSGRPHPFLSAAAAALLTTACYSYVPARPGTVAPGSAVRVRVDRSVPLQVGELPVREDGNVIAGTVAAGSTSDTLMCSVWLWPAGDVSGARRLRGTVSIPAGAVESLDVRRVAKGRTAVLVGAAVAVSAVIVEKLFNVQNPPQQTESGGGENNAVITFLKVRW